MVYGLGVRVEGLGRPPGRAGAPRGCAETARSVPTGRGAGSEDSAHVGAIGLALELLAWQISQPGGRGGPFTVRVGV